ncbi:MULTISPECIES: DUF397 domain-containing protein [Streptomyces]|uniref:DUF397 domain-containing protein n=1 Tax=Streptomyces TaxID=1883 RepID=UPI00036CD740|nr:MULTISPECIES: DUF397 domain-containing protein [Streptomyces]
MSLQQGKTRRWTKSSHSTGNGACVEVCSPGVRLVAVRDSKDPARTPLAFGPRAWRGFVTGFGEGRQTV